jgi:tricorn protease-like protein
MKARWFVIALLATAFILPAQALVQEKKDDASASRKDKKDLPLDGERTVAITTDEGSWISLDVSPDGKTILFELLGDLYTVPIAGGEAKRITDGMAFDSQPRYSPDGSRIVFLSDRGGCDNIWIANKDGADAKALTKEKLEWILFSPEWTPDGKYVIASRTAGSPPATHLWLYHVDGGTGVKLTGNSDEQRNLNAFGPAFGKDERFVYFSERTAGGPIAYNQMNFRWQLGVYDRRTGENFRMSDELGARCCRRTAAGSYMRRAGTRRRDFASATCAVATIAGSYIPCSATIRNRSRRAT